MILKPEDKASWAILALLLLMIMLNFPKYLLVRIISEKCTIMIV